MVGILEPAVINFETKNRPEKIIRIPLAAENANSTIHLFFTSISGPAL